MTVRDKILASTQPYLEELFEFLRIPSISVEKDEAKPVHKPDVIKAAKWVAEKLRGLDARDVTIHETARCPVVTGQVGNDPAKPTILVYGHYDVQPPGDPALWTSPPFAPEIRGGKFFARGATDDKGQLFAHFKAIKLLQQQGALPCNIRFMIEGEEETGSPNLAPFMDAHPEILAGCKAAIISDTGIAAEETPAITVGLRGLAKVFLTVTGPSGDLHSGLYGGPVPNPIKAVARIIDSFTDDNVRILVDGVYDDVREVTEEERQAVNQPDDGAAAIKAQAGLSDLTGEKGFTPKEQIGIRPSFDPTYIHGGDLRNSIPATAKAILQIRTVPDQNSKTVAQMMVEHINRVAATIPGVTVETRSEASSPWRLKSLGDAAFRAAVAGYESVWNKAPVLEYSGGGIPVATLLDERGLTPVLMGFGLNSDGLHGPNEHFGISRLQRAIEALTVFYKEYPGKLAAEKRRPGQTGGKCAGRSAKSKW
jgi:acetylornithine deacetylase/succinyl-diaminopimelate desuccinylase-like protein